MDSVYLFTFGRKGSLLSLKTQTIPQALLHDLSCDRDEKFLECWNP